MVERAAGAGGRTGPPLSFRRDASDIQGCAGGNRDRVNGASRTTNSNSLQTMGQITSEPREAYSASSARPRTTGLLQPQHSSVDSARCQPIGSVPPTSQRDSRVQQVLLSPVIKDGSFSSSAINHHHPPRLTRNITLGDLRSTATRAASAAVASAVDDQCFMKGIDNGETSTNASVDGKIVPRQGWQAGGAWGGRSRSGVENREVAGSSRWLRMSDGMLGGDSSRLPCLETSTAWGGRRESAQNPQKQNSELSELGISFGVSSLRGHRPYMEDEYKVIPNLEPEEGSCELMGGTRQEQHIEETHFFGVFDGHAGGRCSKALTQNLAQTVSREPEFRLELPSAVRKGFLKMNAEFLRRAERLCANDGSTAITAFIRGKRLVVGNVGDSRAVLCSGGRATALSVDHKPNRPDERNRICALGGRVISRFGIPRAMNGILAVSRAFGDRNMKGFISAEPEIREWILERDDRYLVLATDGVWDVMTSQEVCNTVESCAPDVGPQACSEIITAASIRKGSMDNTTAMVIDLRGLWDEDRVGAKASLHRRCNTAVASSPDFRRNHQQHQQQQLKALVSSSNSPAPSYLYGSGMGGGGGHYCNNGGWDGGNTSSGKSTRARGDLHEQLRPSISSMPWTLQTNNRNSPGEEGVNSSITQDGGDSKGPPIGKPGGVGSRSGVRRGTESDHGRRKSWGGGEIVPTNAAATTARSGTTSGIQHKKQFRAFIGQNGAGRGEQSKQQQLTNGARHQRLSDSTSLAPRAWRVNSPSRPGWSIAGGGGGGGAVGNGSRGRGQGFAIPTSYRTGSTELALSVYGRGGDGGRRESSSRSASPSSRRV